MEQGSFIIERTFNAPAAAVWAAITDRDQMERWYFNLKAFRAEPDFEFHFNGGPEDRVYVHICRVLEVVPERKLSHSWRYEGYEGDTIVTWELFPDGDRTRVRLTHSGLGSFPDNPDFAASNFAAGWTHIIGTSLKEYLEKDR